MSHFDYMEARKLWQADTPFYALVMAAMYRADSTNTEKLQRMFPDTWAELDARYNAPGGLLDTDRSIRGVAS